MPCALLYSIQYRQGTSGNFTTIYTTNTDTAYTLNGLSANTTYQWQVASVCKTNPLSQSIYSEKNKFTTLATSQQIPDASQLQTTNSKLQTSLSPNPVKDVATLSISHAVGNVQVSVFDMVGKQVATYSPFKGQGIIKLGVSGLAPGNYLVRVKDDKEETVIKFIKQ